MPSLVIHTNSDIDYLATLLRHKKLPISVAWETGRARSIEQNRLQRQWCREVAEQLGDHTAEEVRGISKLMFGVPIMREASDIFREAYDRAVKPLPYEAKVAIMMEPLDMPVTRLMKVSQKREYLDAMHRHWSSMGVRLTAPERAAA